MGGTGRIHVTPETHCMHEYPAGRWRCLKAPGHDGPHANGDAAWWGDPPASSGGKWQECLDQAEVLRLKAENETLRGAFAIFKDKPEASAVHLAKVAAKITSERDSLAGEVEKLKVTLKTPGPDHPNCVSVHVEECPGALVGVNLCGKCISCLRKQLEAAKDSERRARNALETIREARRKEAGRSFPLQADDAPPGPRQIPWAIAELAYGAYSKRFGRSAETAPWTLEGLAERGGLSWGEMDKFYPAWREECSEIERLKRQLEDLIDAALDRLKELL